MTTTHETERHVGAGMCVGAGAGAPLDATARFGATVHASRSVGSAQALNVTHACERRTQNSQNRSSLPGKMFIICFLSNTCAQSVLH